MKRFPIAAFLLCAAANSERLAPSPGLPGALPDGTKPRLGAVVTVSEKNCCASLSAEPAFRGGALKPSFRWAVLHNWLYFMSLGLSIPNLPRLIATLVNPDGSADATPAAVLLSGRVEGVDKILTFLGVGFLGALSDVVGRKPLMAWSALGYATTLLLQATASKDRLGVQALYLADFIDGISSCMSGVAQVWIEIESAS